MSEISRFSWWFFGLFIIIVSIVINWKKFFLFIIVGIIFMVAGFVKHGGKIKEKKNKKMESVRQRKMIIQKLEQERALRRR